MRRVIVCLLATGLAAAVASGQDSDPPKKPARADKRKVERKKDEIVRIDGKLTTKDPHDKTRPGHYHQAHDVKLSPAKTYLIQMIDRNSSTMDPWMRVEDPDGKTVAQDDDSGGNQNASLVFKPVKEGTYRIIATTFAAGATGSYQITLQAVPPGTAAAGLGGSFSLPLPVDLGDISITPLPAWGGSLNSGGSDPETHGYIEYRFVIENYSQTESHSVKLTLPRTNSGFRMGHYLQALRKTVQVEPNATMHVSLFQPDLPFLGNSDVEVEVDGRVADQRMSVGQMPTRGSRTNRFYGGSRSGSIPIILVQSDEMNNLLRNHAFKSAVGVATKPPTSGGYSSHGGTYGEPGPYFGKHYTYYENIRFRSAQASSDTWSKHWLGYTSFDGIALTGDFWLGMPPEVQAAITQFVECGGSLLIVGPAKLPDSWQRFKEELPGFDRFYPGFGQCLIAHKIHSKTKKIDVAAWDPDDWRRITGMWEQACGAWQHVRSPTDANREFPIVEGLAIPVRGLFIAMLVFVILIGPVNIYWLSRSKRRIWMLWTVPAFSFITCVLLLGYMVATEGWHGHVRADGITLLDETSQRAASIGWHGYYCPTTPGHGLSFAGFDTEVTPHLNLGRTYGGTREAYSVDWSHDQNLADGWITAKVPIHFMMRRNENKRLERITVRRGDDGSLMIGNRLGADVRSIHVASADGKVYTAADVSAGLEATLRATDQQAAGKRGKLAEEFAGVWIEAADKMAKRPADYLLPGCYIAVVDEALFLPQGLQQTQSRKLRTVVFGILKDAP